MTFHVRNPDSKITRLEVFWDGLSDSKRIVALGFAALAFMLISFCMLQLGLAITRLGAQAWPAQFAAIAPWSPWAFGASVIWNYLQTYHRALSLPTMPLLLLMAISGLVMHVHYV